ncbi:DUF953 domain containing protein [Trichuris trichiura]|uniref:Thioredoxin domain-containing protein 17 n=1 Tax=Trichuris trichiura TaxID=36087 RepID=A0A077ZBB8_TRITR|nr:DUF953 domain containing protein [Trichuris trichiura]
MRLEELLSEVDRNAGKNIFVYFAASKEKDGKSWCQHCNEADPVIADCATKLPEDSVLIRCDVGDRPTWKDPNNEYRKYDKLRLHFVPTLIKWGTEQQLNGPQCGKRDLVEMLLQS